MIFVGSRAAILIIGIRADVLTFIGIDDSILWFINFARLRKENEILFGGKE